MRFNTHANVCAGVRPHVHAWLYAPCSFEYRATALRGIAVFDIEESVLQRRRMQQI